MAIELVNQVAEAERAAADMIADANQTARQILQDASEQSYREATHMEEHTEAEVKSRIAQGERSADDEVADIAAQTQRDCETLRRQAREEMARAVKLVVVRLTEV